MSSVQDILDTQQQLSVAIENIYTNFKKDSASRKTSDNLRKKLDILDNYWSEYENNISKLSVSELDPGTKDYISKDLERVKERYGNIRAHIQNYQFTAVERPKSPLIKPPSFLPNQDGSQPSGSKAAQFSSIATVSKTEEMLKKQSSNFKALHRTITGIDLESVNEKWELEDILRTVQSRWSVIDSLHWDIDSQTDGFNEDYENTFTTYERKFQNMKKAINKKMWSVAHLERSTPQMEIPTFSGNYNNWVSFKDLFNETIHRNNSISDAQKMQYLKSKVKGEAERLIQHLQVSSDNYSICWDILNQRYNNKKLIFTTHMNSLMNIPAMQQQSVALIKRIHDSTRECLNAIKNLGVDIKSWDPIVVYLLCQKLDTLTYTDYMEFVKNPREIPNLEEFLKFLEIKFMTLESSRRKQDNPAQKQQLLNKTQYNNNCNQKPNYYKTSFTSSKTISQPPQKKIVTSTKYKCSLCNSNEHGIYYCQQFLELSPANRQKTATKLNLCPNCLYDHQGKPCISEKVCTLCNKAHNRLLHDAFAQSVHHNSTQATRSGASTGACGGSATGGHGNASSGKQVQASSHVSLQDDLVEVLLPTAMIKVQAADGTFYIMRALLDQASQISLITEHAAQQLRIPRNNCSGVVTGIGDKANNSKGLITINCSSLISDFTFETDALIMKQLIRNLPNQTLSNHNWAYLNQIKLADPEFYKCRPIDILLGADIYSMILMNGICRENSSLPIAQQTQLGWILSGNTKVFHCNVVLNNFEDIQKFWQIEDVPESSDLSAEDKQCIEFYQSTTKRREDGSYEVRIPLKPGYENKLGNSKLKATAQFYKLEQKLIKNPLIAKAYREFMNEYLSLNHMTPSAGECNMKLRCYLPHHCVTRDESTTTKLRVVFNASNKTASGLSLNDVMRRGPNLQQNLMNLLIKWRQFKFAFTADLEKMFRFIWIHPQDQDLQMILWRNHQNEKIKEYKLTTVTYGMKASPFLAMMTLRQLAQDEKVNFQDSSAPEILEESFYTDDCIHGAHSIPSARKIQSELVNLLKAGGFNLRKWKSNSPELLVVNNEHAHEDFDFKQLEWTKTLGLGWNPQQDCFTFKFKSNPMTKCTKRALLSEISRIFDPLGLLSPLTTKLKLLFQDIWKSNVRWDEPIPQDIHMEWNKIKEDIEIINQFRIPRWLQTQEHDQIELHGFCDASTKAYGCVIYSRIIRGENSHITLVAGKTKVVPISQKHSLPRLELCGTVLLSKLMTQIKMCLVNHDVTVYGWVDSMVVLGWLNGEADRWKPFVANRVKQVTSSMEPSCWRYVASKENPADCASRGLTASQLQNHNLWWESPKWLSTYVPDKTNQEVYTTDQELKRIKQVNVTVSSENNIIQQVLEKQSKLKQAIRILAWVLRLSNRTQRPAYLSIQELKRAEIMIIKNIQENIFSDEIDCIKESKSVSSKSKIYSLNPILDENGVLRVGGRLRHANMDPEMMHPAIIPNNTRLADLIIDQSHELSYHGGARLTTAFIRRKYWLIGGNNATKNRLRNCVKCRKQNPQLQHQLMGDLPAARTNSSRPFYHCGIDYTGHVTVKASKGRGIKTTKGYIAVFVCMATKAIHLELVSDLTASTFLNALRRMAARRGVPGHIYSDQGTNFIGADKLLKQELSEIRRIFDNELMAEIACMNIEWHFNAPSWPSAGGLWEASVRSLKHHLKRVVGEQHLTFEEFTTLLSQLEGCLNSRPLCPMTEDPDDLNFLTPSHFLTSGPLLTLYDTERDLRTRWHLTQNIFKTIWKRWRDEYLTQLTARSKWRKPQQNLKIDDVVIIKDDNLPPGKWSLGRVKQLHPGSDGYVRVVTLKTKNGEMQRPVVKLAILPVHQDKEKETIEDNNTEKIRSKQTPKRKTIISLSTLFSLILFIFTIPTVLCTYNITPLKENGLYFDHIKDMHLIREDWRLVIYYDTSPYQEGNKVLTRYIDYLDNVCKMIRLQSHCDGILLQLRHEVNELQYYNNILMNHNKNTRTRRGLINGVGNIANSLFGVLDDHFAQKYEQDIELIRQNQNHLAALWKNQTSVVEAEFNLLKRTEEIIAKNHKLIYKKMSDLERAVNQVNNVLQNISIMTDFLATSMIANNLLFSLKNVQQTLLDAVTNVYNGKFDFHLLTPNQLRNELGIISEQLPTDLSLPIKKSDSLSEIYNLLQVKARVINSLVIFEIMIPLKDDASYEILRAIPIPHKADNQTEITVVPISNYVAVNLQHDAFMKISQEDVRSCVHQNDQKSLCRLHRPISIIKDDQSFCETLTESRQCKTTTSPCVDRWIELNQLNTYIYFCCNQCLIKLVCGDQISPIRMTNSGLLSVNQGCIIKSSESYFYTHRQDNINQMNMSSDIKFPQINGIIKISLSNISHNIDKFDVLNHTLQLQDIERRLTIMKQTEPLSDSVSIHDIHHYAGIYIILLLMGVGVAVLAWRRSRLSWVCRSRAPPAPCPEEVSGSEALAVDCQAAKALPSKSPTSVQFSEMCEKSNKSACVSLKRANTLPNVHSARVQNKETGSSPIAFHPKFRIPDDN